MEINQEQKNNQLLKLIEEHSLFPQRFLYTKNNNFVYSESDKNIKNVRLGYKRFNILKSSKYFHNRGKLLEDILIIEYLLSQIIFLRKTKGEILFFDYGKVKKWNEYLDKLTFYNKTELIDFCGFLDEVGRKKINNIRKLRNNLAHSFSSSYFEYKKQSLRKNFDEFKKDFYDVLNILVRIHNKLWEEYSLEENTISWIKNNYEN